MSCPERIIKRECDRPPDGIREIQVDLDSFPLELGGVIRPARIRACLEGPEDAPLVVLLGGISADRYAVHRPDGQPGWWADCIGKLRQIQPGPLRTLCLDYIHCPHDPAEAETLDTAVTAGDQAAALVQILDALAINRAIAVIGASFGGTVGLALAEKFPGRLERLIIAGAAHKAHPMAIANRVIQRRIVQQAARSGHAQEGLALARQLAMTTYRSAEEFAARFGHPPGIAPDGIQFEVGRYLTARGKAFADTHKADRFLSLSQSLDLYRTDPSRIDTPVALIACEQDRLVPYELMKSLADRLGGPHRMHKISSPYAHDAFLKEPETFAKLFAETLSWEVA